MIGQRSPFDAELEERLVELGARIDWPAVPDFSTRVTAVIAARAAQPGTLARLQVLVGSLPGARRLGQRSLVIALVALLAIAVVAAAIGLGVPGIRIEFRPIATASPPGISPGSRSSASLAASTSPTEGAAGLHLGPTVTLEEARRMAGFELIVPMVPGFGAPSEVHLLGSAPLARVSLVYGDQALITEFLGRVDPEAFQKVVSAGSTVEPVSIGRTTGYWITGAPHQLTVLYRNPDGTSTWEVIQVTGNVLIWEAGPVTARLQTSLDRDSAVDVASSAR